MALEHTGTLSGSRMVNPSEAKLAECSEAADSESPCSSDVESEQEPCFPYECVLCHDVSMGEDVMAFNNTSVIGTMLQGSQCESDDGYEEAQLESSSEAGEAELVESSDESFTKCVRQQQANQDRSQQACMLVADNDDVNEMSGKASDWIVGQNMGTLLRHPDKPLGSQAQALVANVYANVRSLPVTVLKAVLNHPSSVLTSVTRNFADYVAAHLLGLGRSRVRGCWDRLRCQDMQPRTPDHARKRRVQEVDDATKAQHPHNNTTKVEQALAARIRECLAVSYRGFPDVEYQRRMHRLALAGLVFGSKYNSINFVQLVEALAMQATRSMTADAQCNPARLGHPI